MMRIGLLGMLLALAVTIFALQPVMAAPNPNIRVEVLPIDCVFDTVVSGDQMTTVYITPEACGHPLPPDPVDPPAPTETETVVDGGSDGEPVIQTIVTLPRTTVQQPGGTILRTPTTGDYIVAPFTQSEGTYDYGVQTVTGSFATEAVTVGAGAFVVLLLVVVILIFA